MNKPLKFLSALVILSLMLIGIAWAGVRDGSVKGKSGLSYRITSYEYNCVNVVVSNSTKYNVRFGGSMLFLDRNYRVLARAELMQGRIKRHSSRTYKAFYSEGTGDDARKAFYLEWEF